MDRICRYVAPTPTGPYEFVRLDDGVVPLRDVLEVGQEREDGAHRPLDRDRVRKVHVASPPIQASCLALPSGLFPDGHRYPAALVAYLVAVVVGLAFGATDQYLGTIRFDPWAWTVSGMSAPWLVLPFVVGMTQERARRAIALGLIVTLAALVGYFAMTYSPMESVPANEFFTGFFRVVRSGYNPVWIAAGIVIGPLYGYLGHRWRVARSWVSAVLVTGALCLESGARDLVGRLDPHPIVWWSEVAIGVAAAVFFALVILASRPARATAAPHDELAR
jgi:Family of unknown function (DUF6518)